MPVPEHIQTAANLAVERNSLASSLSAVNQRLRAVERKLSRSYLGRRPQTVVLDGTTAVTISVSDEDGETFEYVVSEVIS